MLEKNNSQTKR